ncbi:hypothetical protein H4Q26_013595 [Puccinia striiformis f. sp. tritici PST-130]|nr:hypothetical protein H4Q26_013595 [Puccinia striiformis f. sp. tritici PST-130]
MICTITGANENVTQEDDQETADTLIETGSNLSDCFKEIFLVLDLYLIPLISLQDSEQSTQIDPKIWFSQWNKQFLLATQNLIDNAKSFPKNISP